MFDVLGTMYDVVDYIYGIIVHRTSNIPHRKFILILSLFPKSQEGVLLKQVLFFC